jgi:N-carbamoylputrescine amidase
VKILVAAVQMRSNLLRLATNLEQADVWLKVAHQSGAEMAVLPEMFNTGYGLCHDFGPYGENRDGPSWRLLRERSRAWKMSIAAGFVERDGRHLHDSLGFVTPEGAFHVYRKRNLVFWERSRFLPGRTPLIVATPWGRIGFAICADMIYHRVWHEYRDQIDLAVIAAAWPQFADRESGSKHWLLGHVGPLSASIPGKVADDLGIPVIFANQSGATSTFVPILKTTIPDRFAGRSSISDGRQSAPVIAGMEERLVIGPITIASTRRSKTWHFTSNSAFAA